MQTRSTIKTFITATLALFIISCNSSKKDKVEKDKPANAGLVDGPVTSQPATDPKADIAAARKCFTNEGLKYKVDITLNYSSVTQVTGNVVSKELESGKTETVKFTGVITGDKLSVEFRGKQPVIGAGSEWTNTPWTIEYVEGTPPSERLSIIFKAKNYETNKWEDTGYKFESVDCK